MATFKGFDDFSKKFEKKVKEASGPVNLEVLFNEGFMQRYTKVGNIQEFFDKSPFKLETEEDFDKIDEAELDIYVSEQTTFGSWDKMKGKAGEEYLSRKLKF
jgi:hypothetical protein